MNTASPLELNLLAFAKAVPDLRRAVRRHLGASCADIQLCVTELVGNVVRHLGEGTPVRVRVARTDGVCGGRIRIEVTDPDPRALPVLLCAVGNDESGRGLALLDAVALPWSRGRPARRCGARWGRRGDSGAGGLHGRGDGGSRSVRRADR